MSAFTRLGCSIWDWEPWTELDPAPRILWLALYTSGEAKRHVPGLWQGGIPSMADAARLHPDAVITALDQLLERELVEYDSKYRVLRLCDLPDAGEYPSNGKVIRGWWTKFNTVPPCPVRDAHVRTIAWILDTGSTRSGKAVTDDHKQAWDQTFGKVVIPAQRRRGVRRLADSDTSTQAQPSLFGSPMPSGNGMSIPGDAAYPQEMTSAVDNSASLRQSNKIRAPETVSDTVSDTNRIPDPGSRIPDSVSSSGEGGSGGGHTLRLRPTLTLVPPYTAEQVLRELAAGCWDASCDRSHLEAVGALIPAWAALGVGLAEFALLAQHNAVEQRRWSARTLLGCDIQAELEIARRASDWREVREQSLRVKMP